MKAAAARAEARRDEELPGSRVVRQPGYQREVVEASPGNLRSRKHFSLPRGVHKT